MPEEYRWFLLELGNGDNKIFALESTQVTDYERLKFPFPYTESFNLDDYLPELPSIDAPQVEWDNYFYIFSEENEPQLTKEIEKLEEPMGNGSLYLLDNGCGSYDFLIVNGICKGQVWVSDEQELYPLLNEEGDRLSFVEWLINL